jgi:carbonyl reductase 1
MRTKFVKLALQYLSSHFNNGPLLIYLTAKDASRGQSALDAIRNDHLLRQERALRSEGVLIDVEFHLAFFFSFSGINRSLEVPYGARDVFYAFWGLELFGYN